MNVGSLFSGIGGIELGFKRAGGFETKWFVEWEPYAQAVLRKNFTNIPIYGDIKTIDWTTVTPIDVLTGGFPCQDISIANPKGKGIEGKKSGLWKHYLEAIRVLRPKYIVAENSSNIRNKGLHIVLADLASLGYDAEWFTVRASQFGAHHRRERTFIVGYPRRIASERNAEDVLGTQEESSRTRLEDGYLHIRLAFASRRTREGNGLSWIPEPCVGRVANGVPRRVDRIRCLGNAVVPQCAEAIAKIIKREVEHYATKGRG